MCVCVSLLSEQLGKTKAKTRILGLTATFVTTFPKYCVNKDTIMVRHGMSGFYFVI